IGSRANASRWAVGSNQRSTLRSTESSDASDGASCDSHAPAAMTSCLVSNAPVAVVTRTPSRVDVQPAIGCSKRSVAPFCSARRRIRERPPDEPSVCPRAKRSNPRTDAPRAASRYAAELPWAPSPATMTSTPIRAWCLSSGDGRDDLLAEAPEVGGAGVDIHYHVVDAAVAPGTQTVRLPARCPAVTGDLLAPKVLGIERGDLDLLERSPDPLALCAESVTVRVDPRRARDHVPGVAA